MALNTFSSYFTLRIYILSSDDSEKKHLFSSHADKDLSSNLEWLVCQVDVYTCGGLFISSPAVLRAYMFWIGMHFAWKLAGLFTMRQSSEILNTFHLTWYNYIAHQAHRHFRISYHSVVHYKIREYSFVFTCVWVCRFLCNIVSSLLHFSFHFLKHVNIDKTLCSWWKF